MSRIFLTLLFTLSLSACSILSPFKVTMDQGNIVTTEALALVTLGMTKEQVRFLIGTPVLKDVTNDNLWTYYYQDNAPQNGGKAQTVTMTFENGGLVKMKGTPYLKDADLR
jgi:outer membrane protein assembly factor BamE